MKHTSQKTYRRAFASAQGLTLAEVLIASALFGLILGIMAQVMRDGIKFFIAHNAAIEVQQQCLTALDRMGAELGTASAESFQYFKKDKTPDSAISWASKTASPEEGKIAIPSEDWKRQIGFYTIEKDGNNLLLRKEALLNPPRQKVPKLDSQAELRSLSGDPRLIARNIIEIKATKTNPTALTVAAQSKDKRYTIELRSFILMKN